MKILFIDNPSIQNSIRIGLMEEMAHHEVHLIAHYGDAIEFFKEEKPDIVIIDFTIEHGVDAMKKILTLNPHQFVITLSDALDCSEILGCDFCIESYHKRRVSKHQGIHDLLYLIDNFLETPCEFAHKLEEYHPREDTDKDEK